MLTARRRAQILYNAQTRHYVLFFHCDTPEFAYPAVGIARAQNITGPYEWVRCGPRCGEQDARSVHLGQASFRTPHSLLAPWHDTPTKHRMHPKEVRHAPSPGIRPVTKAVRARARSRPDSAASAPVAFDKNEL